MQLGDILHLALRDATAKLRADRPDWFAIVDEIKTRPGWEPFADASYTRTEGRQQYAERGHPFPKWAP
jgi:hypothetical protein